MYFNFVNIFLKLILFIIIHVLLSRNYIFLKLVINFVSYTIFVFLVITVINFVWNK